MWYLLSITVTIENLAVQRLVSLQEMQYDLKSKLELVLHVWQVYCISLKKLKYLGHLWLPVVLMITLTYTVRKPK